MLQSIITAVQPWADYYADHRAVSTAIIAIHLLAMFVGGGIAVATDRQILRVPTNRFDLAQAAAAEMESTHRVVITALLLVILSGALLFLSEVETFAVSPVYWAKMSGVVLLLLNGLRMQRAERVVAGGHGVVTPESAAVPVPSTAWGTLTTTARVSLVLWLTILLLGVVLTNV